MELAVKGSDLIAAGMKPGPELGQELDRLLNLVIEDPSRNTRDYLMKQLAEVGQDKTDRDEI